MLAFDRKNQRRFEELVGALDPAQRGAVVAVLERFAATESGQPADAARAALERWKAHLPAGTDVSRH